MTSTDAEGRYAVVALAGLVVPAKETSGAEANKVDATVLTGKEAIGTICDGKKSLILNDLEISAKDGVSIFTASFRKEILLSIIFFAFSIASPLEDRIFFSLRYFGISAKGDNAPVPMVFLKMETLVLMASLAFMAISPVFSGKIDVPDRDINAFLVLAGIRGGNSTAKAGKTRKTKDKNSAKANILEIRFEKNIFSVGTKNLNYMYCNMI